MGRPEPHLERQDAAVAAAAALASLTDRPRGGGLRRLARMQDRRGGQDKLLKVVQYVAKLGALACAGDSSLERRLHKLDKTISLSRKVSKTGTAAQHVPQIAGLVAYVVQRVRGKRLVNRSRPFESVPVRVSAPDPVTACVAVGNAIYVVFDNLAWLTKYGVLSSLPRAQRSAAADRLARVSAVGEVIELIADCVLRRGKLRDTFRLRDHVNSRYNTLLRQQDPGVQPGAARIVELDGDDDDREYNSERARSAALRGSELLSASAEMEALSGVMDNELMMVVRNGLDVVEAVCTITEPLWGARAPLSTRTRARLQLASAILSARDAWHRAGAPEK